MLRPLHDLRYGNSVLLPIDSDGTVHLMPYIQVGIVQLIDIPDLPIPVKVATPETPVPQVAPLGPLVACVDDSPLVCQTIKQILTTAGYQFVSL